MIKKTSAPQVLKFFFLPAFFALLFSTVSCSEPEIPQGYAIVYGITQYEIGWSGFLDGYGFSDLSLTDDDAIAVAEMLENKGWEVRLRLDDGTARQDDWENLYDFDIGAADLGTFEADMAYLSTVLGEDDRFLFYYSGHGYDSYYGGESEEDNESDAAVEGDEWIYLYAEGTDWDTDLWSDYTLNDDALGQALSELPNSIKMVILDCCNSGGFIGTSAGVDTIPWDYTLDPDAEYDGGTVSAAVNTWLNFPDATSADILASEAIVIAAAGESEESWEKSEISHGIFTYYLLETPAEADDNNDGWITVTEAYEHCLESINENWNADEADQQLVYPFYNDLVDDAYLPHLTNSPLDFVLFAAD